MNALIFLTKRFRKMGQFRAIRDFFDTLLVNRDSWSRDVVSSLLHGTEGACTNRVKTLCTYMDALADCVR
jgi:hypothetical protein